MKRLSMKKINLPLVAGTLWLLLTCALAHAQSDDLRRSLFKDADAALNTAKEQEAIIYAPGTFAAGMNAYQKAEAEFQKGEEIKDIQEKIAAASASFAQSVELAQRSKAFFSSVITARQAAIQAEAGQNAAAIWQDAETRLGDAIKALESADDSSARAKGVQAETAYREAELDSIKLQCLGEARALLQKAEEAGVGKNAPLTLDKSAQILQKAEKTLEENRLNTAAARKLAAQAQAETSNAMALSQKISRLTAEKKSLEEILLEAETATANRNLK